MFRSSQRKKEKQKQKIHEHDAKVCLATCTRLPVSLTGALILQIAQAKKPHFFLFNFFH